MYIVSDIIVISINNDDNCTMLQCTCIPFCTIANILHGKDENSLFVCALHTYVDIDESACMRLLANYCQKVLNIHEFGMDFMLQSVNKYVDKFYNIDFKFKPQIVPPVLAHSIVLNHIVVVVNANFSNYNEMS